MVPEPDASDRTGQPSDRRKLIVVVHADVVGCSRRIGLDDIGTLDRMRRLRRGVTDPVIATYGGQIVNTGGDALLMVFDSVDGTVRSALRVKQQVPILDGEVPPEGRMTRIVMRSNPGHPTQRPQMKQTQRARYRGQNPHASRWINCHPG